MSTITWKERTQFPRVPSACGHIQPQALPDCLRQGAKTEFGTIFIDRDADGYSSASGIVSIENGIATLGDNGSVTYSFKVESAGNLRYGGAALLSLLGQERHLCGAGRQHKALHGKPPVVAVLAEYLLGVPRKRCNALSRDAYHHHLSGRQGVQFYGFRVCSAFSEEPTAGEATFALAPRSFKDVDGNMAVPDKGFKLTLEMLRGKPDSALIWYEDFQGLRCAGDGLLDGALRLLRGVAVG